jgi:hypothetical protein
MANYDRVEQMNAGELYQYVQKILAQKERGGPLYELALVVKSLCRSVENVEGDVTELKSQ